MAALRPAIAIRLLARRLSLTLEFDALFEEPALNFILERLTLIGPLGIQLGSLAVPLLARVREHARHPAQVGARDARDAHPRRRDAAVPVRRAMSDAGLAAGKCHRLRYKEKE